MRLCVAFTLSIAALTNAAYCVEDHKAVSGNRVPTELGFYEALTRAKKIVEDIAEMSPNKRSEWFHTEKFVWIPAVIDSRLGFGSVRDGLYTYIWAQDPSGKCQIFGLVVEFYSGGLWFQVTSRGVYRFDPSTNQYTEMSPRFESSEYPALDTLPFIPRKFDIAAPTPKTETAE